MKYKIRSWMTGLVICAVDIDCEADALESQKLGLAVVAAIANDVDLSGADLRYADFHCVNFDFAIFAGADFTGADFGFAIFAGADFTGANFAGANFAGANFAGANFAGAQYGAGVPLTQAPLQLLGLRYFVLILDEHIKIGCELHETRAWANFWDRDILEMDGKTGLKWWREHKGTILALAKSHQGIIY